MTPEAFTTQNLTLSEGRGFSAADDDSGRLVCALGFDLAAKLFPRGSPLGETIKFQGIGYKVVGVLAQRGALFGQSRDNFIAVPLGTARRLYGENLSVRLQVQAPNRDTYGEMVEQARGVMRAMRRVPPGDDDDFEIVSNESAVGQFRSLTSAIRLGVASAS
jgi:putative ABC transport system permease protein